MVSESRSSERLSNVSRSGLGPGPSIAAVATYAAMVMQPPQSPEEHWKDANGRD